MTIQIPPAFINVLLIITPCNDGTGNIGDGLYQITALPEAISVTKPNTAVNYQLLPPTPDAFRFLGMEKKKPHPALQLSNPTISVDGKNMMFFDSNTVGEPIEVILLLSDGKGTIPFDPQIQNTPE